MNVILYCVRTQILFMPECIQFESVKSIIRNLPPNGTAGLVRQSVRTPKRSPRPPAKTRASVLFVSRLTKRAAGDLIQTPMKYAIRVYPFYLIYLTL